MAKILDSIIFAHFATHPEPSSQLEFHPVVIERKELAEIGAKLGKNALEEITTIAKPDTILAWNRKFANQKVDASTPSNPLAVPVLTQNSKTW